MDPVIELRPWQVGGSAECRSQAWGLKTFSPPVGIPITEDPAESSDTIEEAEVTKSPDSFLSILLSWQYHTIRNIVWMNHVLQLQDPR